MQALELRIPPPLVTLLTAGAMWVISFATPAIHTPHALRISLAVTVSLIGLAFGLAGMLTFRLAKTTINPHNPKKTTSLVCSGVYRITRNPMYVGLLFTLLAWAVFLSSLWCLLGIVAFVLYIGRFQIAPEERVLEAIFGSEFLDYKARVRRWL